MNINLLYVGIDAIAIILVLLVAVRIARESSGTGIAWIIFFIALGVMSYVLSSRQDYSALIEAPFRADFGYWHPLMNLVRNSTPAFFALMCHIIFRDERPIPKVLIALLMLQLLLEEPLEWILGDSWSVPGVITLVFEAIPSMIQVIFGGLAIFWMLSETDADLDPVRRRARVFLVVMYCVQVALSLGIERVAMGYGWIPFNLMYPLHVVIVAIGACFSIVILLVPQKALPLPAPAPTKAPQPSDASAAEADSESLEIARLKSALGDEKLYQQAGLSVGELARQLAVPEYRLRGLIHNHLGYRNFNALLHHYRVEEVAAALADPTRNTTPILTLALTAGYQSINPFNRAFRELKGMTPTEYRKATQAAQQTMDTEEQLTN